MCTVQKDYLQGRGKKTKGGGAGDDAAAAFDKGRIFDRCACWHWDAQKSRGMKGQAAHLKYTSVQSGNEERGPQRAVDTTLACRNHVTFCCAALDGIFWGVRCRVYGVGFSVQGSGFVGVE
jgi:hypothetical protein